MMCAPNLSSLLRSNGEVASAVALAKADDGGAVAPMPLHHAMHGPPPQSFASGRIS